MKKIFIGISLFLTIGIKADIDSTLTDCGELYFSEIMRSDVVVGGTHFGDYVIEIFNPTTSPINLDFYTVEMLQANGTVRNLDLNGWIAPKTTYLMAYDNAESTILALADLDTTLLDLGQCIRGRLIKHVTGGQYAVDVFGQTLITSQAVFNYVLFMQNPAYYLATYGVNIDDLQNVDIRRGYFVMHGVNPFVSSDVWGTWAFYAGVDQSDLGNHTCMCNRQEADLPVVGYKYTSQTLNEVVASGNYQADMTLQWSAQPGSILITQGLQDFTAVIGTHIQFSSAGTAASTNCYYISTSGANCAAVVTMNNAFVGTKQKNIVVDAALSTNYIVDAATGTINITINGGLTAGLKEHTLDGVSIYPAVTSDYITIKSPIDGGGKYTINNMMGEVIQRGTYDENESKIPVSNLSNAMYFINFTNTVGKTGIDKFIKQ